MKGPVFVALAWAALSLPAMAGTIALPQGCEGTLTVQLRACLVTHVWTCAGDAPGDQWVGLFTQDGLNSLRKVDTEFQWLETYHADGLVETMEAGSPDPASVTTLLETGEDAYDFAVTSDDGQTRRFIGYDRLTGAEVTIDGEPLLATEFAFHVLRADGTMEYSLAGRQYISAGHRLFFLGQEWDPATPAMVTDASPVTFSYPGDPGFLAADPLYDCGVVTSDAGGTLQGASQ